MAYGFDQRCDLKWLSLLLSRGALESWTEEMIPRPRAAEEKRRVELMIKGVKWLKPFQSEVPQKSNMPRNNSVSSDGKIEVTV